MNLETQESALIRLMHVIHTAAQATTAETQVQEIVNAISEALGVDVCTLYRSLPDESLSLVASHGLNSKHPVVVPANCGLVGEVLRFQHSINIINPDQHPEYYFVADSKEEQFHSFCGVPLVYRGLSIGVLVVQRRCAEILDTEQEVVLTTLAAHLALLLMSIPISEPAKGSDSVRYTGISGAQGIAIGNAVVRMNTHLAEVQKLAAEDVLIEREQWKHLKIYALEELNREKKIVCETLGDGLASVLDAYTLLLQDTTFDLHITSEIDSGFHLPWALKRRSIFFQNNLKPLMTHI